MAQDHLILHTNDRVVTSTSLGNQEKWFDAEKNLWYKVDNGHFEALAEAMASEVLPFHQCCQSTGDFDCALLGRYRRRAWFAAGTFGQ